MVAVSHQYPAHTNTGFRIAAIERDCLAGRRLSRTPPFRQSTCSKNGGRLVSRQGESAMTSSESWIELNGLLKEILRRNVIGDAGFADMPQAALIGRPTV